MFWESSPSLSLRNGDRKSRTIWMVLRRSQNLRLLLWIITLSLFNFMHLSMFSTHLPWYHFWCCRNRAELDKNRIENSDLITLESFAQTRDKTSKKETAWRHLMEKAHKQLQNVQLMESLLGIGGEHERWAPGMAAWELAQTLVQTRDYRCCLSNLEALVVAWIFELMKMNMSRTGKSYWTSITAYTLNKI